MEATKEQVVKAVLRDSPFLLFVETATDSSMKKLLMINDLNPNKLMREAILDVMNKLRKSLVAEAGKDIAEWVSNRTYTSSSALPPSSGLLKPPLN